MKDSTHSLYGRRYATKLATNIQEANEFLDQNKDYSCLADLGGGLTHLAKTIDRGSPLSEGLPLAGVYRKDSTQPGLGLVLFSRGDKQLVAQETAEGERVAGFSPIDPDTGLVLRVSAGDAARRAGVGDDKLYAFQKADLSLAIGTRAEIAEVIRRDLPNLRRDHIFAWEEASDFINDGGEFTAARTATTQFLRR